MKEKLMEILRNPIYPHLDVDPIEALADYLIDSGVVVSAIARKPIVDLLNDVKAKGFWEYGTDRNTGETGGHDMTAEDIADYLLENGVTVQTWIPVTERLPDKSITFVVVADSTYHTPMRVVHRDSIKAWEVWGETVGYVANGVPFTHWMPIPELPKGE